MKNMELQTVVVVVKVFSDGGRVVSDEARHS